MYNMQDVFSLQLLQQTFIKDETYRKLKTMDFLETNK